jgi:hypothetical protein
MKSSCLLRTSRGCPYRELRTQNWIVATFKITPLHGPYGKHLQVFRLRSFGLWYRVFLQVKFAIKFSRNIGTQMCKTIRCQNSEGQNMNTKIYPLHSSVGIATGYKMDGRRSIPGSGKRFFFPPQRPDRLWAPPSFLSSEYGEIFIRG